MRCVKCRIGEPKKDFASLTYTRENSVIQIKVEGIPAEICPICKEIYLSEAVAQPIYDIVTPLLNIGEEMAKQVVLPPPSVLIQFPHFAPAQIERAMVAA